MRKIISIILITTTVLMTGCTDKPTSVELAITPTEKQNGETSTLSTFTTSTTVPINSEATETNIATDEKDDTGSSETIKMDPSETREIAGLGKVECGFQPDKNLTPRRGYVVATCQWNDKRGNNIIIISHRAPYDWHTENPGMEKFSPYGKDGYDELVELFAYHYIYSNDLQKWKAYRTLHDFAFGESGIGMDYQPKSLHLSDINHDGKAESSIFYIIRGGTSHNDCYYDAKLIFHPDVTKYKVIGTTGLGKKWVEDGEYTPKTIEEYDRSLSKEYLDYLKVKWAEYHTEQLRLDAIRSQGHC